MSAVWGTEQQNAPLILDIFLRIIRNFLNCPNLERLWGDLGKRKNILKKFYFNYLIKSKLCNNGKNIYPKKGTTNNEIETFNNIP